MQDRKTKGLQASPSVAARIERIKAKTGATTVSEVLRRSLDLHERLLDADMVEIVKDGKRYLVLLP